MEINISEEEQRQCFIEQWNNPNVLLVCEVPVFCRSVDLVTYDKNEKILTSIEFKTKNWKKAIEQVMSTAISFDYLEICIRKPKTEISQKKIEQCCSDIGIGLYFFDIETRKFEHSLLPQKVQKIWKVQKKQVIEFVEKGDVICKKS
jgi:hypothetical protein